MTKNITPATIAANTTQIGNAIASAFISPSKTAIKFKKYKTFSALIYSYINTSGNWKTKFSVYSTKNIKYNIIMTLT